MPHFDLTSFIQAAGYVGVASFVFAESGVLIGLLLPGDSLLFTAGLLASQGYFNIFLLAAISFAAAIAGDAVGYAFGKKVGPRIFNRKESILLNPAHIKRTQLFFEKHGPKTIVLARFLPIVRTFAPILAGVGGMRYRTFFAYNVIGAAVWAVGLLFAGFFLGKTIPGVDRYLLPIIALIIVASVAPTAIHVLRDREQRDSLVAAARKLISRALGRR